MISLCNIDVFENILLKPNTFLYRIRWAVHNAKAQKPAEESVINSVYVRFITPRVSK